MAGAFSSAFSTAFDRVGVSTLTCVWPIDIDACCQTAGVDSDDPRVGGVIAQVSEMLTVFSGGAVGGCATLRPLEPCGTCRGGSCCTGDCIVLHGASDVIQVRIDGGIVDPTLYYFDPARGTLCAVPPMEWPKADPRWQETGTLEVDVATGAYPGAWDLAVANELACELLRSCTGGKCRLPSTATQVTSLGVTVTLDPEEIKYLIPSVRSWVAARNPAGATMPGRVFSPEADRARVMGSRRRVSYPWRPW